MSELLIEAEKLVAVGPAFAALDGAAIALRRQDHLCARRFLRSRGHARGRSVGGPRATPFGILRVAGREARRWSVRAAGRAGIGAATAGHALLPGLPVWRSLILGREPTYGGFWPLLDRRRAMASGGLAESAPLGISAETLHRTPEKLSAPIRRLLGSHRAFAMARTAVLLDEPTSGLSIEATALVLRRAAEARAAGMAVLLATPNVQHAWAIGDQFVLIVWRPHAGVFARGQTSREELFRIMLGNQDFQELGGRDRAPRCRTVGGTADDRSAGTAAAPGAPHAATGAATGPSGQWRQPDGVARHPLQPQRLRPLAGLAVVHLAQAEAARGYPLAIAQELIDRLHQEHDQRQNIPVEPLGLGLVATLQGLVDPHLDVESLGSRDHAGTTGAQHVGQLEATAAVEHRHLAVESPRSCARSRAPRPSPFSRTKFS